jgi:hypothetical protein
MATFFRNSRVWVVEFTYDGRPRQWMQALPEGSDARSVMAHRLHDLYGAHARLASVRPASEEEERDFGRGDLPKNPLCPTGRAPRSPTEPPE